MYLSRENTQILKKRGTGNGNKWKIVKWGKFQNLCLIVKNLFIHIMHFITNCHAILVFYNDIHNVWAYTIKPCKVKNKDNVVLA